MLLPLNPHSVRAEPVKVARWQGTAHGFLTLRTLDGKLLATGDLVQVGHGERVTSRLTFRFRDGSLDDETTIFTQRGSFELVSDRLVQRGPSFPDPMDALVLANGDVTIRSLGKKDKDGKDKVETSHIELPPDTSNGMIFNLMMNIPPKTTETKLAMVAQTGKGRLVHLSIKPDGEESFTVGGARRMAITYRIHIELGGIAGVVAPVIGKQPEDIRVWMLGGDAPALLKVEGQLYEGGPIWRMETVAGVFGTSGR